MNSEDKIDLILAAVKAATTMEGRGNICEEYEPQEVNIVYNKNGLIPGPETRIELMFRNGTFIAGNWGGHGKTFDECLEGNMLCMKYELEDQIRVMTGVLQHLNSALEESKFKGKV
jgi:hypothetical protein